MTSPKVNSNKQVIVSANTSFNKNSNVQEPAIWKFNDIDGLGIVDIENDFNNNQILHDILKAKNWLGKKWNDVGNQINELLANINIEDDEVLYNLLKQANESNSTNIKSKSSDVLVKEYMNFIATKGNKNVLKEHFDKIIQIKPYLPSIAAIIDNFSEYLFNNFDKISINKIDESLKCILNDGKTLIFDKNTGLREISNFDKTTNVKTIYNLKTNTKEYIEYRDDKNTVKKQIIEKYDSLVYDKNTSNYTYGNKIHTQTILPSAVENFYNITTIDSNGKSIQPTQYCTKNELGEFCVSIESISPSGYGTSYYYEETADNMEIMSYKITDPSGNIIMNKCQTIQLVSDNKVISSINNHVYEVEFHDNILIIIDKKNSKQKEVHLDFIKEGKDVVIELLKKIPANILIAIDNSLLKNISYTDNTDKDNGHGGSNVILIGKSSYINDYEYKAHALANFLSDVMLHEYGHYLHCVILDVPEKWESINNLLKTELNHLFKQSSSEEQETLSHLFFRNEAFAESILSLFGNPSASEIFSHVNSKLCLRKFYFMKDFPQLIAKINEIIETRCNIKENNKKFGI